MRNCAFDSNSNFQGRVSFSARIQEATTTHIRCAKEQFQNVASLLYQIGPKQFSLYPVCNLLGHGECLCDTVGPVKLPKMSDVICRANGAVHQSLNRSEYGSNFFRCAFQQYRDACEGNRCRQLYAGPLLLLEFN